MVNRISGELFLDGALHCYPAGYFSHCISPARSGTPEEFARRPSKILTALIVKGIALDVPLWGELRSP
jgi:hypothetical protein